MKMNKRQKFYLTYFILGTTLLLNFQNCSQPGSISLSSKTDVAGLGQPVNSEVPMTLKNFSTETFASTELNKPVEFNLTQVSEEALEGIQITDSQFTALKGSLELVDAEMLKFKYTPDLGFRGSDISQVTAVDNQGRKILFNIKLVVANPVQNLKPALALRGMGCIQCHAKVESNIITDFGYGNDYFFSNNKEGWWKNGGIYGDHGQSFNTMDLNSNLKLIVPKANLPANIATATKSTTLAQYVSAQLKSSATLRTKSVVVQEIDQVSIGSPISSDITSAFSMKSEDRVLYFKNSENALGLSGLIDQETYFKNADVLNCEGDVALRGPVLFNNLKVNTISGCRIYVIGSVFIYGPISYVNSNENSNLQITSTSSISLGLGFTKKDGVSCEPQSRYATAPASYGTNSLTNRYKTFWTVQGYYSKSSASPLSQGSAILAEAGLIEAKEGTLLDASCRSEGRNVSFDRLFLNAPAVQSRYEGNFSGTIIAEYSVMSLGMFKFQYDPVFDRVPLLPMLNSSVYLKIE